MSPELTQDCIDLAERAQREGIALFAIHTTDTGDTRYIGPRLPPALVAKMLRAAATGYEEQVPGDRLN